MMRITASPPRSQVTSPGTDSGHSRRPFPTGPRPAAGSAACAHAAGGMLAAARDRAGAHWPADAWRERLRSLLAPPCNHTVRDDPHDRAVPAAP